MSDFFLEIHTLKRVEERQKEVRLASVDADIQHILEDQFAQHFHSIDLTTQIAGEFILLSHFIINFLIFFLLFKASRRF